MKHTRIPLFLFLLLGSPGIQAQSGVRELERLQQKYPDEEYIQLDVRKTVRISVEDDTLSVTRETYEEGLCIGDRALGYSNRSAHSSRFSELTKLEAYSVVPKGKSYSKRKVKDFTTSDFVNSGIFHDDSKETSFRFSGLTEGAKTAFTTEHRIHDPHLMPLLVLSMYAPLEEATFTIIHNKDVEIGTQLFNCDTLDLEYSKKEKGRDVIHTWKFRNVAKLDLDRRAQAALYYAPQLTLQVKKYKTENGEVRVLENLDDLHAWYCNFLGSMDNDETYIAHLADSIAGDLTDTLEIVSNIYQWVQKNIKYVAFEEGYKGYIPEDAEAVCSNRYGDCKGMSNLLNSMLQSHGIRSNLAWVGTRDLPYRYNELPTPNVDNHMIAVLEHQNEVYFMDPTHSNLPFGMPSPFIQEKEVLMNRNCEGYKVLEAPLAEAHVNLLKDSSYLTLEDRDLVGIGTAELHGYVRMTFFDYRAEQGYDFLKKYCRSYLQKGNNKFVLDTVWLENEQDPNLPLLIRYRYHIRDYLASSQDEKYLNLNLEMTDPLQKVDKERKLPLELRYRTRKEYTYVLDLGNNLSVNYLPENQKHDGDKFNFSQHYAASEGNIERSAHYETDYILLKTEDFTPWNEYVEAVNRSFKHRIVLDTNTP